MFETPEQFREKIRGKLHGTFAQEAGKQGIKTLREEDPQQNSIQAPPQQDKFNQSMLSALENLSMAFKARGQLESGVKLMNAGSSAKKSIGNMYKAVNDPNIDMKTMANIFKKELENVFDSVVRDVETLSKKKQQDQQKQSQQGQQDQQPQQLNAEEGHGNELEVADEAYGDNVVNRLDGQPEQPVVERNDPISVDAMQGILKFATPQQVADAIKKMTPEDFQQFTNGLQKTALDVIAKAVNTGGVSAGGPAPSNQNQGKNNNPSGSGGNTDKEGNLKLGDL